MITVGYVVHYGFCLARYDENDLVDVHVEVCYSFCVGTVSESRLLCAYIEAAYTQVPIPFRLRRALFWGNSTSFLYVPQCVW